MANVSPQVKESKEGGEERQPDEPSNVANEEAAHALPVYKKVEEEDDFDALSKRFAALKKR